MRIKSKDLDLWAKALGVSNDAEAMAALKKHSASMLVIAASLTRMRQHFLDAGVPDRNPVMDEILKAASYTLDAGLALGELRGAFARHERGAV